MKLAAVRNGLSAGHAIPAATSGFAPGALKTASVHVSLDLWDGQKAAALPGGMRSGAGDGPGGRAESAFPPAVPARAGADEARAAFEGMPARRARGGYRGRGKAAGRMAGMETVWRRYYGIDLDAEARVVEKTGWRSMEAAVHSVQARIALDAATGAVVSVGPGGLSYGYARLRARIAPSQACSRPRGTESSKKGRSRCPGFPPAGQARRSTTWLRGGVIAQASARPAAYRAAHPYPVDPSPPGSIGGTHSAARTDLGGLGGGTGGIPAAAPSWRERTGTARA